MDSNWKTLQKKLKNRNTNRDKNKNTKTTPTSTTANESLDNSLGRYVAIDCEFVGVGSDGLNHALARISIVNYNGSVLLDEYVRPLEKVVDFRTWVSGIKPFHLKQALSLKEIQDKVATILKDRIIIGHGLTNDFKVLFMNHPWKDIRDTSKYPEFKTMNGGKTPSLKKLAQMVLNLDIQQGSHSSVEDARIAMLLYRKVKKDWEAKMILNKKK